MRDVSLFDLNRNTYQKKMNDISYKECISINSVKAKLLLLKLIHLFASETLLVKNLEIEETKTTYYSTF